MEAWPRRTNGGSLRLARWNADGVQDKRLDHFLGHHGVDICLVRHLIPGQAFRFANYVCHCTDQLRAAAQQYLSAEV